MSIAYSNGIAPNALYPVFKPVFGEKGSYGYRRAIVGTTVVPNAIGCVASDHAMWATGSTFRSLSEQNAQQGSTEPATNLFVFISPKSERAEHPSTVLPVCNKCAGTVKRLITTGNRYVGRSTPMLLRQDPAAIAGADIPTMIAAMEQEEDQEQEDRAALRLDTIRENWDTLRERHLAPFEEPDPTSERNRYEPAVGPTVPDEYGCSSVVLKNMKSSMRPGEARSLANRIIRAADRAESITKQSVKP